MDKDTFEQTTKNEFRFLQDKYGFLSPITEDFGREIYVRFDRNNQTVSISYEFGSSPLIELFYPAIETGEPSTPWAEKNGVRRTRRFPDIKVVTYFIENDPSAMIKQIKQMAKELEITELSWLKA